MARRHAGYDSSKRREHDVDIEKEMQRLKEESTKKDAELNLLKGQKVCLKMKVIRFKKSARDCCMT